MAGWGGRSRACVHRSLTHGCAGVQECGRHTPRRGTRNFRPPAWHSPCLLHAWQLPCTTRVRFHERGRDSRQRVHAASAAACAADVAATPAAPTADATAGAPAAVVPHCALAVDVAGGACVHPMLPRQRVVSGAAPTRSVSRTHKRRRVSACWDPAQTRTPTTARPMPPWRRRETCCGLPQPSRTPDLGVGVASVARSPNAAACVGGACGWRGRTSSTCVPAYGTW